MPTPSELKPPFSVIIVRDPKAGVIESFVYGADERAVFEADLDDAKDAGYSVWGVWQPIFGDSHYKPQQLGGYFQDAYGAWRAVGNSDYID